MSFKDFISEEKYDAEFDASLPGIIKQMEDWSQQTLAVPVDILKSRINDWVRQLKELNIDHDDYSEGGY